MFTHSGDGASLQYYWRPMRCQHLFYTFWVRGFHTTVFNERSKNFLEIRTGVLTFFSGDISPFSITFILAIVSSVRLAAKSDIGSKGWEMRRWQFSSRTPTPESISSGWQYTFADAYIDATFKWFRQYITHCFLPAGPANFIGLYAL